MPFDGSGNYVVPAGTQGVPGTVIDSTKYNTLLSDLQTALTLCVTRNGQSAATANLPMGGFKLTGLAAGLAAGDSLRWEQLFAQGAETAIASAATLDIGAVNSSFLRVTGSTGPITSLGTNYNGPRFLRFIDTPTLTHNASTLILPTGANIIAAAGDTCIAIPKATSTNPDGWVVAAYQRATGGPLLTYVTPAQLQGQTYTAFTTAGTATAFTLTPTPAITAYAENQEFDAEFHTASSGTPTLNISAVAAKSLKYRDSTGTLVSVGALIPSGWRSKVVYDGTDLIVREMPPAEPAIAAYATPVRQTVLSGPVDSNGLPNFGGSTGSTTVIMTGTLVATAANGAASTGAVDLAGSIVNASWTGLSTNGTMYLYLTVNTDGTCTTGSTTLAPNYQWGGTYSTTSGQSTFNVQDMTMKVGNGSSADQAYRVFVGQVTVAGSVVTAITWFSTQARYRSPWQATLPNNTTPFSVNHNMGVAGCYAELIAECTSADASYAVGDEVTIGFHGAGGGENQTDVWRTRLSCGAINGSGTGWKIPDKSSGVLTTLTNNKWKYRFNVNRGW
ncbi:MAG: hypothetical protein E6Q97_13095 [Desulfurellales bacterium]|nr:MAG: hypothetical protein E6Q97_13095 [Desulfurellales bacterium]